MINNFPSVIETAVRDPLVVILVIFALGGLAVHFFFKRHPIGRATVRVVFLILLTITLVDST